MNRTNRAGYYVWYRAYHRRVACVMTAVHQGKLKPLEPDFKLVQVGNIALYS